MKKRGRPATGNSYPAALSVMVKPETRIKIDALAIQEARSTAFVIRDLIERGLESLSRPDCGSGCSCQQPPVVARSGRVASAGKS